jgi:ketosteroid isomerase-like protein
MAATSHLTPVERVQRLFAAIDSLEAPAPPEHVTDDVVFRLGSNDPVLGKPAFTDAGAEFFGAVAGIHHDVHSIWEPEAHVVVTEMDVTYTRLDGSTLTLPCCNVFRLREGLIASYSIYMDIAPVFG